MHAGTEFDVIGAPAVIAEERFARGDSIAVETEFHEVSSEGLRVVILWALPDGRPEAGLVIASNVVNQKILSVSSAVAARSDAIRRSEFATTRTRNCGWRIAVEIPGDGVAEIRLDLCAPHGAAFVSEIHFEKCARFFAGVFNSA